jgi:pimeloyl-ACP methyl ester carboxylesterase/DNA-binding CsgD family transcriptional regulator
MATDAQHVQFCTTKDGVRLAYAVTGKGPPLVRTANWLGHLDFEWQSPVRRPMLAALSRDRSLIRYDQRGCGLSEWNVRDISFTAWLDDLEAVVDAAGLDRFPLVGLSQGCAIALAYAARHPERVTHLMLYGGFVLGKLLRDSEHEHEEAHALARLAKLGWGKGSPEFRQVFTSQFMPDATPEQQRAFDELQRIATSPENAVRIIDEFHRIDVREAAAAVRCPTLVLHARHDRRVPYEEGRHLASLIPGARFVTLETRNHVLLPSDPAWQQCADEIAAFPGALSPESVPASPAFSDLSGRERGVLELVARGFDNSQIAQELALSPKTVRNHVSNIFGKLGVSSRAQAIVQARDAGFGRAALH